ncbi:hypothetical protein [Rhodopseudomonas sp. RCAM05734]|uniref:hypothetical protein n=1 Tax=Rhodopseudomonas sp. RCAM05734 TaxID=3457549 RepID=UPI0040439B07
MVHSHWDRVRMELTGGWQRLPVAAASVMAGQGPVTQSDPQHSSTVPDSDGVNVDHTDALLEHIAKALADRDDQSS